jgi:hypothetical protein
MKSFYVKYLFFNRRNSVKKMMITKISRLILELARQSEYIIDSLFFSILIARQDRASTLSLDKHLFIVTTVVN